jgi:hypothetical protein
MEVARKLFFYFLDITVLNNCHPVVEK